MMYFNFVCVANLIYQYELGDLRWSNLNVNSWGCPRKSVDRDGEPVVFVRYVCSACCCTEAVERRVVRRRLLRPCTGFR